MKRRDPADSDPGAMPKNLRHFRPREWACPEFLARMDAWAKLSEEERERRHEIALNVSHIRVGDGTPEQQDRAEYFRLVLAARKRWSAAGREWLVEQGRNPNDWYSEVYEYEGRVVDRP